MMLWRALSMVAIALAPAPLCVHCASANLKLPARMPALQTAAAVGRAHRTGQQFYVSATAGPAGDGSLANPWDLSTALSQPATVRPGATIWVRGGTYGNGLTIFRSRLVGTAAAPIVVRNYPGERATINGGLQIGCCDRDPKPDQGAYTWFWGLEVTSSITDRTGTAATDSDLATSVLVNAIDSGLPGRG